MFNNTKSNFNDILNQRDSSLNEIKKYVGKDDLTKDGLVQLKFNIESYLHVEEILNPIKIKETTFDKIEDIFSKYSVILSLHDSIKYTFKRELSSQNVFDGFWVVEDGDKRFYLSNRPFTLEALKDRNFRDTEEGKFFNFLSKKERSKALREYIHKVEDNLNNIFDNPKYKIVGVKFRLK